jgi:RNA polymerase sigma factor (sigma-70 family)
MSFENLVRRISPTLKGITKKLNGHHSFFDDDDLYQEALCHLWTDYGEGILEDKTDSYILQGCYFHLRNYLRKTKDHAIIVSLNTPVGEDGVALEELLSVDQGSYYDHLDSKLQIETAEKQYLTEREKNVLTLSLEDMSMREIGAKLGISHVMVLKIRNKIRDKYVHFNKERPHGGYRNGDNTTCIA